MEHCHKKENTVFRDRFPVPLLILLSLFFILSLPVFSQPAGMHRPNKDSLSLYVQMKYGPDQHLYNGFLYYERYAQYVGDPYFPEIKFYEGSVILHGKPYDGLRLKYNIYTQQLVLQYTDFNYSSNQLIIDSIHIDAFRLGESVFIKKSLPGKKALFYQELHAGTIDCYIHWSKDARFTGNDARYAYAFSRPAGTFFIRFDGQIHSFSGRKTFLSVFPEEFRHDIKQYISQHNINFRDARIADIQGLLSFVAGILENQTEP